MSPDLVLQGTQGAVRWWTSSCCVIVKWLFSSAKWDFCFISCLHLSLCVCSTLARLIPNLSKGHKNLDNARLHISNIFFNPNSNPIHENIEKLGLNYIVSCLCQVEKTACLFWSKLSTSGLHLVALFKTNQTKMVIKSKSVWLDV